MTPELSQRLSQELRLTPQLLELVKILQLPRLELQQLIRHEIEMNPFLTEELIEEEDEDIKEIPEEQEAEMPRSDEIDYEYFFHDDWSRTGYDFAKKSSEDDEFNPVDIYSQPMTLRDHLLRQIHLQFNDAVEVLIGEFVTDSLSDEGLLDVSINEIAESLKVETELIEAVLKKYRFLEPVGIGSKDTRECLLTQLEFVNKTESLEYTLLRDFYDDFITNKIYKIEAKLKISSGRLENAIDEIKKLNPKPANGEWDKTSNYVIPDVIIERKGDELIPYLNTTNFPELHLNKKYMEMLKNKDHLNKEEEKFLKQKLNSAMFMVEGIHKRNRTLMKITERIIMLQKDFFDFGVSVLNPMILYDIADYVGMHESTISRAIESKFVDTPQGIYPYKFFFSRGIKTERGETSSTNVKDIIKTIVLDEASASPLTDIQIVDMLKEKYSITIARRTVAKYREQLNILPTAKRKKYFKEV